MKDKESLVCVRFIYQQNMGAGWNADKNNIVIIWFRCI